MVYELCPTLRHHKALASSFDVGNRTPHQHGALATAIFHADSIRILPADCSSQGVSCRQLNFDVRFIANNGLDLSDARQVSIERRSAHKILEKAGTPIDCPRRTTEVAVRIDSTDRTGLYSFSHLA